MAYSGYLIKIGDYIFPLKYIRADSFSCGKEEQDLDSYRDGDGELHRNALEHWVPKAEFETKAMLTNTDIAEIFSNIRRNYINPVEKNANVTFYIQELDEYVVREAYVPTIIPTIYYADENIIKYNPIRFAIIGY